MVDSFLALCMMKSYTPWAFTAKGMFAEKSMGYQPTRIACTIARVLPGNKLRGQALRPVSSNPRASFEYFKVSLLMLSLMRHKRIASCCMIVFAIFC